MSNSKTDIQDAFFIKKESGKIGNARDGINLKGGSLMYVPNFHFQMILVRYDKLVGRPVGGYIFIGSN